MVVVAWVLEEAPEVPVGVGQAVPVRHVVGLCCCHGCLDPPRSRFEQERHGSRLIVHFAYSCQQQMQQEHRKALIPN
ncbi:unnamed protein product [Ilex paraguariensis]|uniref:Secreted protein n=1 Tax=Ilex paraguariensis TaxID=185542 RepID=A0ABC8TID0_9AQUA